MLKKLQNLLFEEDEDDFDEDEEEEEIVPVRSVKPKKEPVKETPAPAPAPAPKPVREVRVESAPEEPKKSMQRIDLTQPVETVKPRPVQEVPASSLFVDDTPEEPVVVAPKPKKLGITVDDAPKPAAPAPKPVRTESRPVRTAQAKPAAVRKEPAKKEPVRNDSGYIFKPVISPIFGVDEKDLHALKTTTSKISEAEKQKSTGVRPQIISPIYGADQESTSSFVRETPEASPAMESVVSRSRSMASEDTIPEFSLDDILKARDEETKSQAKTASMPVFPDLDFDDDEDDDKTILIKRSDVR